VTPAQENPTGFGLGCHSSRIATAGRPFLSRAGALALQVEVPCDATLVSRVLTGDAAALGLLYDRHAPLLLGAALRCLGSVRGANDLVHDVFLEAWEHASDYDPARGSVRTWLLVRLRSRALDLLGRAELRYTTPLGLQLHDEMPQGVAPFRLIDELAVRQALGQIEPRAREVVELTYRAGFTAQEVAELTCVPLGTVRSRLARGLAALGSVLGNERDGDADD
jgi:RNA polymerase sigma-70 factor (ECF subfamily)